MNLKIRHIRIDPGTAIKTSQLLESLELGLKPKVEQGYLFRNIKVGLLATVYAPLLREHKIDCYVCLDTLNSLTRDNMDRKEIIFALYASGVKPSLLAGSKYCTRLEIDDVVEAFETSFVREGAVVCIAKMSELKGLSKRLREDFNLEDLVLWELGKLCIVRKIYDQPSELRGCQLSRAETFAVRIVHANMFALYKCVCWGRDVLYIHHTMKSPIPFVFGYTRNPLPPQTIWMCEMLKTINFDAGILNLAKFPELMNAIGEMEDMSIAELYRCAKSSSNVSACIASLRFSTNEVAAPSKFHMYDLVRNRVVALSNKYGATWDFNKQFDSRNSTHYLINKDNYPVLKIPLTIDPEEMPIMFRKHFHNNINEPSDQSSTKANYEPSPHQRNRPSIVLQASSSQIRTSQDMNPRASRPLNIVNEITRNANYAETVDDNQSVRGDLQGPASNPRPTVHF